MDHMRLAPWALTAAVVLAGASVAPAQDAALRADAASMQRKLVSIVTRADLPVQSTKALPVQRTAFTDREANAYFRIFGPEFLPEGVTDPQVAIDAAGRVRARAIVDLDQALKTKERSWLDPLAWVTGKLELAGVGTLRAVNGRGVFMLESTTLGGVAISNSVMQEIVSYYSRSPENPRGFVLGEQFELPSAIKAVETAPGRAVVVQ